MHGPSDGEGRSQSLADRLEDGGNPSPVEGVQKREMLGHLQEALDRLDEEFRAVLVLRDINELDYQQIAEVLAVPIGTVKSRLFRARLALRQELAKLYGGLPGKSAAHDTSASAGPGAERS